jgi:hypothetical protein
MKRILTTLLALGALIGLEAKQIPVNIVPQPNQIEIDRGSYTIAGVPVSYDRAMLEHFSPACITPEQANKLLSIRP